MTQTQLKHFLATEKLRAQLFSHVVFDREDIPEANTVWQLYANRTLKRMVSQNPTLRQAVEGWLEQLKTGDRPSPLDKLYLKQPKEIAWKSYSEEDLVATQKLNAAITALEPYVTFESRNELSPLPFATVVDLDNVDTEKVAALFKKHAGTLPQVRIKVMDPKKINNTILKIAKEIETGTKALLQLTDYQHCELTIRATEKDAHTIQAFLETSQMKPIVVFTSYQNKQLRQQFHGYQGTFIYRSPDDEGGEGGNSSFKS